MGIIKNWNQKRLTESSRPITLNTTDYSELSIEELRKRLDEKGVVYSEEKTKYELEEILRKSDAKVFGKTPKPDKLSDKIMKKVK